MSKRELKSLLTSQSHLNIPTAIPQRISTRPTYKSLTTPISTTLSDSGEEEVPITSSNVFQNLSTSTTVFPSSSGLLFSVPATTTASTSVTFNDRRLSNYSHQVIRPHDNEFTETQCQQIRSIVEDSIFSIIKDAFGTLSDDIFSPLLEEIMKIKSTLKIDQSRIGNSENTRNSNESLDSQASETETRTRLRSNSLDSPVRGNANHSSRRRRRSIDFMEAVKSIRINTTIITPLPKFDIRRTTAKEFLSEVERYYVASGYQHNEYLYLVKTLLPHSVKLWWDHYKDSIKTWKEFKKAFIAKYDTTSQAIERMQLLNMRKQKSNEPTDSYIYEMMKLSKVVYAEEPVQQAMDRTRNGMFHRLRVGLGAQIFKSPEDLLEATRLVHASLLSQDNETNVKSQLPPISSQSTDKNTDKWSKKNYHDNRNGNKEENQDSNANGNRKFSFNFRRGNSNANRGRGSWNPRFKSSNKQNQEDSRTKDHVAKIRCFKCNGFGHTANVCPSSTAIAMAAISIANSSNSKQKSRKNSEDTATTSDNLNN